MAPHATAVLAISLDVDEHVGRQLAPRRMHDALAESAARVFDEHGLAATWALAEPAISRLGRTLIQAGHGHEIALLTQPSWSGAGVPRGVFAAELAQRLAETRSAGLEVTTLAARDGALDAYAELLSQHGLTALRAKSDASGAKHTGSFFRRRPAAPGQPQSLWYGLWEMPETVRLTTAGSLKQATKLLDRAVAQGSVCHIVVDLAAALPAADAVLAGLTALVIQAERQQTAGGLRVETLSALSHRLTCPRTKQAAARSILKAA